MGGLSGGLGTVPCMNALWCSWCRRGVHSVCVGAGAVDEGPCHCECGSGEVTWLSDGPCERCEAQLSEYCRCCDEVLCEACWISRHVAVLS